MLYVVGMGAGSRSGMTIAAEQAILGSELIVPTLDGDVKYSIPAGTQPGDVFKL